MDYPYGYCGMPCALCTRYRTDGVSRCAGCSASGYYTDACKVYRCCREKQLNHCGNCGGVPCERLGKMSDFKDLRTDNVKSRTFTAVSRQGFDAWYSDYAKRADMLTTALERYNDGRMKRYLCELFIRQDIQALTEIMRQASGLSGTPKEVGRAFRAIAEQQIK